jgi:hypothetical protein
VNSTTPHNTRVQQGLTIAVLGAGPLGTLLAAQLRRGGAAVTLIRRDAERSIERFYLVPELWGAGFELELTCTNDLALGFEVVVVAVRAEQLDDDLLTTLKASQAKCVLVFSPLLASALGVWRASLPGLVVGMPVLAAEFSSGSKNHVHFWQMPSTVIERGPEAALTRAVVSALRSGGAWVKWAHDAERRTLANTVALFPFHVAVFLKPCLGHWHADRDFRRELSDALTRSRKLAKCLGPVQPVLSLLLWWLSSSARVGLAVRVANGIAPRVCRFVERHFGAKLGRQHAVLAGEIARLAHSHALADPLNERWRAALPENLAV